MPYQYPVRTLSLGNDRIDNSLDRQHKFNMGVCVGGYYNSNKQDWRVDFEIDPTLVPDYFYRGDAKVEALPEEYYVLTPSSRAIIPKGSFSGLIEVQLTDAFFEDPKALTGAYVIPIRITGSPDTVIFSTANRSTGRRIRPISTSRRIGARNRCISPCSVSSTSIRGTGRGFAAVRSSCATAAAPSSRRSALPTARSSSSRTRS